MENDVRWHLSAKCLDYPSELFFSGNPTKTRQAVNICLNCPVRIPCIREADERGETYGVWGGVVRHKVQGRPSQREESVA